MRAAVWVAAACVVVALSVAAVDDEPAAEAAADDDAAPRLAKPKVEVARSGISRHAAQTFAGDTDVYRYVLGLPSRAMHKHGFADRKHPRARDQD